MPIQSYVIEQCFIRLMSLGGEIIRSKYAFKNEVN